MVRNLNSSHARAPETFEKLDSGVRVMSSGDVVFQDVRFNVYFSDDLGKLLKANHIKKFSQEGAKVRIPWLHIDWSLTEAMGRRCNCPVSMAMLQLTFTCIDRYQCQSKSAPWQLTKRGVEPGERTVMDGQIAGTLRTCFSSVQLYNPSWLVGWAS